ncbi:ankyrin repeat domain-containing protein [archaeon]|nr:MAG: ankyrin repeat domain-containing protein [archaeon]
MMVMHSGSTNVIDTLSSPLISAVVSGRPTLVARLIRNNQFDIDQVEALHVAAAHGNVDCLRILLEYSANVEKEVKVSCMGCRITMKILIEHGFLGSTLLDGVRDRVRVRQFTHV